ncbi:hypothetical protein B9K09_11320 [Pseudomonas sp. M30-35]|nr:hypothetical protein B9K09_11275 [Pseudomonas sp. M30-35]ARU88517.1 hypothetical protein B9K09_11320 [Pseudomonas sp. M30-35]
MTCQSICAEGQFYDFETESCKWPEDENCPSASNWNPDTQDCVCDGDGVLSNVAGFRMCFAPADGECTKDSPDFVGYYNETTPFCNGRARCPDGTQLGGVGSGDSLEYVCLPKPSQDDPSCPGGQFGAVNGKQVCIPKPGADPSCPSGQSGTVGGQTVCLPKPGDSGGCKEGETPGFAGTGAEMNATCVPANYKPETCPAGSYSVNQETGGFACVTVSDGSKPGDDGGESGQGKGGSSDGTAKGSIITKDAAGNVTGQSEIELKLPDGLLQDQPTNTYYKESVDFGDKELEKLDAAAAEVVSDFSDPNGMFTERSKLDDAGDYMLGLFGYSTGCSGDVVFWNGTGKTVSASCDKLERMKRILGWLVYVTTCMGIFNILTRKNED